MIPILYTSEDDGAPVLTGESGALINVLDACLVNGYGTKAAAGWTKAFSGTNEAAYQQGVGSQEMFLHVDDENVYSGRFLVVRGNTDMTAIDAGTGQFPTTSQNSTWAWMKSTEPNSNAKKWWLVATHDVIYLAMESKSNDTYGRVSFYAFAATDPHNVADNDAVVICGSTSFSTTYPNNANAGTSGGQTNASQVTWYAARNYLASENSEGVSHCGLRNSPSHTLTPISGSQLLSPVLIRQTNNVYRSTFRGIKLGCYDLSHTTGQIINVGGVDYMAIKSAYSSSAYAYFYIDLTSDWDA